MIVDRVSKSYGPHTWAVRDITLRLVPGVLGLLGPNGAGKSSLIRIIATITQPSDGNVIWNGADVTRRPNVLGRVLGYLPQDFGVYPNLNAIKLLTYLAAAKGLERRSARKRIDQLLEFVNLKDVAHRPLGGYSGGMRQRVGIAQALLNDPQVLIVDEPTVGLDPEERTRFRNLLIELAADRIVVLSTHIVADVEATASRIALVAQGQLLRDALPTDLLRDVEGKVWGWIASDDALPAIRARYAVGTTIRRPEGVHVRVLSDMVPNAAAEPLSPTLEDAYLHVLSNQRASEVSPR